MRSKTSLCFQAIYRSDPRRRTRWFFPVFQRWKPIVVCARRGKFVSKLCQDLQAKLIKPRCPFPFSSWLDGLFPDGSVDHESQESRLVEMCWVTSIFYRKRTKGCDRLVKLETALQTICKWKCKVWAVFYHFVAREHSDESQKPQSLGRDVPSSHSFHPSSMSPFLECDVSMQIKAFSCCNKAIIVPRQSREK